MSMPVASVPKQFLEVRVEMANWPVVVALVKIDEEASKVPTLSTVIKVLEALKKPLEVR